MTAAERVARGAALLDAEVPRWWERVEVLSLDMKQGCECILGQVFADDADEDGYTFGRHKLGLRGSGGGDPTQTHGFDAIYIDGRGFTPDYNALQAEWTRVIESRRSTP